MSLTCKLSLLVTKRQENLRERDFGMNFVSVGIAVDGREDTWLGMWLH